MKLFNRRKKPTAYLLDAGASGAAPDAPHATVLGGRAKATAAARRRIGMCAVCISVAFVALGGRVAYVSLDERATFAGGRGTGRIAAESRPEIWDRNGRLLAVNLPMTALEIEGDDVWDAEETASRLAKVLPSVNAAALAEKLAAGRYVSVVDDLTPRQQKRVFALGLGGVHFRSMTKRFYPQGALAAHLIGHTAPGEGGVMGLEYVVDQTRPKAALQTTIDIRAQQIVEDALADAVNRYEAAAGWASVIDVETGDILALANEPDFDPNAPGLASDEDRYNSAVYGRFEYGSAFKAISAAMALDAGVATEAKQYDARKPIRVGGHIIRDLHGKKRLLTFSEVVQYSSNIGMSRVAAELGPERQRKYLTDLNALDTLPIALKERRAPMPPGQWGPSENATVSFGHGIAVTSLHVLSSFSAVVNGGVYRTPGFLADGQQRPTRRVFSEETSHTMRRILRRVVTHGTASLADVPGYYPIGKTATADKPSNGGYDRSTRLSSFVGAFPGQAPKYAIMVTLDAPQPTKETQGLAVAGVNAAPTFARIASRLGPLFGEATVREREALRGFMERPANTIADAGRQDFNHVLASGVAADRSTVGSRTIAQAPLISGAPVARTQIASTQFASTQIETEQSAP